MAHDLTCHQCGKSFPAVRSDAKYCGDACRQEAHRGIPPHPERPRGSPEPEPEPKQVDPHRRAWLAFDRTRCWFRMNFDTGLTEALWDPRPVAHHDADYDQHWVAKRDDYALSSLRSNLRQLRATIIETDYQGPLPSLWLLELQSSPDPIEQGIFALMVSLPRERWRPLVLRLADYAHPDKPVAYRPLAADRLLEIVYGLKDDPEFPKH
jgi:hypothetical protein